MSDLRQNPNGRAHGDGLASVLLPPVVHEASAAVLIVDLDTRLVTYANDLTSVHISEGELHCATNTLRTTPTTPWWKKH